MSDIRIESEGIPLHEIEVLSAVLNDPYGNGESFSVLKESLGEQGGTLFNDHRNRLVYEALDHIYGTGNKPSPGIIVECLKDASEAFDGNVQGYLDYVLLTPMAPSSEHIRSIVRLLHEKNRIDRASRATQVLSTRIGDGSISTQEAAERLKEIEEILLVEAESHEAGEVAYKVFRSETPTWYVPTGLDPVDESLGGRGLAAGMLTVCAARAKVGKTIFMNNLLVEILKGGATPIVLNLETRDVEFIAKVMSRLIADPDLKEILRRELRLDEEYGGESEEGREYHDMMCEVWERYDWSRIEIPSIRTNLGWGSLTRYISNDEDTIDAISTEEQEMIELIKSWFEIQQWELHFDRSMGLMEIEYTVKSVKARLEEDYQKALKEWNEDSGEPEPEAPKVVLLIDYLQLLVKDSMREREELTQLTKGLKGIAIDQNISVFTLAQLNRNADNAVPRASDLRGSGSIEQDADTVIALYNPTTDPDDEDPGMDPSRGTTLVTIPVARHSHGGDFKLKKDAAQQRFTYSEEEFEAWEDFEEFTDEFTEVVLTNDRRRSRTAGYR